MLCKYSIQNHVIRQSKVSHEELGEHGMKIQEAFEDITSWVNYVLSPTTSLEEESTKKYKEK